MTRSAWPVLIFSLLLISSQAALADPEFDKLVTECSQFVAENSHPEQNWYLYHLCSHVENRCNKCRKSPSSPSATSSKLDDTKTSEVLETAAALNSELGHLSGSCGGSCGNPCPSLPKQPCPHIPHVEEPDEYHDKTQFNTLAQEFVKKPENQKKLIDAFCKLDTPAIEEAKSFETVPTNIAKLFESPGSSSGRNRSAEIDCLRKLGQSPLSKEKLTVLKNLVADAHPDLRPFINNSENNPIQTTFIKHNLIKHLRAEIAREYFDKDLMPELKRHFEEARQQAEEAAKIALVEGRPAPPIPHIPAIAIIGFNRLFSPNSVLGATSASDIDFNIIVDGDESARLKVYQILQQRTQNFLQNFGFEIEVKDFTVKKLSDIERRYQQRDDVEQYGFFSSTLMGQMVTLSGNDAIRGRTQNVISRQETLAMAFNQFIGCPNNKRTMKTIEIAASRDNLIDCFKGLKGNKIAEKVDELESILTDTDKRALQEVHNRIRDVKRDKPSGVAHGTTPDLPDQKDAIQNVWLTLTSEQKHALHQRRKLRLSPEDLEAVDRIYDLVHQSSDELAGNYIGKKDRQGAEHDWIFSTKYLLNRLYDFKPDDPLTRFIGEVGLNFQDLVTSLSDSHYDTITDHDFAKLLADKETQTHLDAIIHATCMKGLVDKATCEKMTSDALAKDPKRIGEEYFVALANTSKKIAISLNPSCN